ncbi:MAG: isoprenylcysteine carboxylmethyltransferase family protein [Synergistaceae bacterium]
MNLSEKISSLAFRCRGLFWGVFAVSALVFHVSFSLPRFIFGILILAAGQILRFWAAGYIPKYRTEIIGAPVLVTWGPYKWVRNPLYAGNFVMGIGWSMMLGWWWVLAFSAAFLFLYWVIIIPAEEKFLENKFKVAYSSFKDKVPPLFPFPRKGFPDASEHERLFDSKAAWSNEIYSMRVNFLVTVILAARLYFTR